jgi:hypothetical protein
MAEAHDWAEMWCQLFGYYSCYQLSTVEAFVLSGLACLAAIVGFRIIYGLCLKLIE